MPYHNAHNKNIRLVIGIVSVVCFCVALVCVDSTPIPPSIPRCPNAPDVIVGNGEYNKQTGYWSEYDCVSDWRDERISIKRGAK